jgi:hypothetical protein
MGKVRIIKEIYPDGETAYIIQQKHFLFFWWWVAASINNASSYCNDSFLTLEEAKKNLCYFNGTKTKKEIIT